MPKKHKTRKQKIQAEHRKTTSVAEPTDTKTIKKAKRTSTASNSQPQDLPGYSLSTSDTTASVSPESAPRYTKSILTKGYESLTRDIRKTTIVTGAIVLVQLLVYFYM